MNKKLKKKVNNCTASQKLYKSGFEKPTEINGKCSGYKSTLNKDKPHRLCVSCPMLHRPGIDNG
jgi:hypothetical protein